MERSDRDSCFWLKELWTQYIQWFTHSHLVYPQFLHNLLTKLAGRRAAQRRAGDPFDHLKTHLPLLWAPSLFILCPAPHRAFDEFRRGKLFGIFNQLFWYLAQWWTGCDSTLSVTASWLLSQLTPPHLQQGPGFWLPDLKSSKQCFHKDIQCLEMSDTPVVAVSFYGLWYLSEGNN